jgi:SPP1 gp7 family putative phage head morphogenesis protein
MMNEFLSVWRDQAEAVTYKEIREMLSTMVINQTLIEAWNKDYVWLVNNRLAGFIKQAVDGAEQAIKRQNNKWDFDASAKAMQEWSQTRAAQLVVNITADQRQALQNLLQLGANSQAYTVDELSRVIRPTIGLTKRESRAVYNYYASLVENGTRANVASDRATGYAGRMHRHRAMRIARTEIAYAYNFAADKTIQEAQEQRLIGEMQKVWSTAKDDRVCEYCRAMEGKSVGMNEMFTTGISEVEFAPAHPHCRCSVKYEEVAVMGRIAARR